MSQSRVEEYRKLAAECWAKFHSQNDPVTRARWERLGKEWDILADQEEVRIGRHNPSRQQIDQRGD